MKDEESNSDGITGTLEDWARQQVSTKEFVLYGYIYGDSKDRFPDGSLIHTSGIANRELNEGDIVTTRNSVYKLGKSAARRFKETMEDT